ncbi:Uncharacterised protein [Mycobacterium tuberculosis]|nr:Uncharacterised protein [Mycobacterium tuberculosis]
MELAAHLRYHIHIPACFLPSQWGPAMFSSLPWAPHRTYGPEAELNSACWTSHGPSQNARPARDTAHTR